MSRKILFIMFLVILIPITELYLLISVPYRELSLKIIWSDPDLRTSFENPIFFDSNFTEGWTVVSSSDPFTSGFSVLNGTGVLYADFKGKTTYIQIGKVIDNFSTSKYPYIVIIHKEDSSDGAINFSFGVVDENDVFHDGGRFHSTTNWTSLVFDLRRVYNGTVRKIYLRLSNDFDTNYKGGLKHAYVKSVAVYQYAPNWELKSDRPVNAKLTTKNHVLSIWVSNAPNGSLIAAQRVGGFEFDLRWASFLKVSIRTSSVSAIARVVVWTDDGKDHLILLKTYNDDQWHTEIIQLSAFGVYGKEIVAVQLGTIGVDSEVPLTVSYKDLSFISWVPK